MIDEIENDGEGEESSPEIIAQAREMGWVPKDEYRSDPKGWRSAEEFVERGEHILPIVQATAKKLRAELLTRDSEVASLKKAVESSQLAIKALQKSYTESTAQQVAQARAELRAQLKSAKEVGDVDAELEVLDKLDELKTEVAKSKEIPVEEVEKPKTNGLDPEFIAWNEENDWFGDDTDVANRKRTRAIIKIGADLRDDGEKSTGKAFMDKCLKLLEEQEGKGGRQASKVEGAVNGRESSGGGFASLSKEARDVCHEDNDTFVGPGKMFKTVKEWENHFYNKYKESEG
ncbi:MAG: hypothetical protein KGI54_07055 [Pseudomonadota bacterium]|nr:hypothetical protein [Pseudomonadota bacterium]